jgi:membrane-associated phospholipid phosphatase
MAVLWPADILNLVFLCAHAFLQVARWEATPHAALWLAFDLGSVAAVVAIAHSTREQHRRGAMLRLIHGMVTVPLAFTQVGLLIAARAGPDHASTLAAWDRALFGCDPLVAIEVFAHPLATEVLQWCYALYLITPVVAVVLLLIHADTLTLVRSQFSLLGVYYGSYLGYHIFPASGPNIHNNFGAPSPVDIPVVVRHTFTDPLPGVWQTDAIREWIFNAEVTKFDCFPSGHVAVAICCLVYAFRAKRCAGWMLLPLCLGIVLSTVWLRYHYVVDVFAGILLALVGFLVLERMHRRYESRWI